MNPCSHIARVAVIRWNGMQTSGYAARRGLGIHLQFVAIAFLIAVIAIPLFGSLARRVSAGVSCAGKGYRAAAPVSSCSQTP